MTRKIGLYLRSEPKGGGEFQYSQAMLDAVAALPPDRYSVVVGFSSVLWLDYLQDHKVRAIQAPHSSLDRALSIGATLADLPVGPWRKLSAHFSPLARRLMSEQCDLWIFPAQDMLGFQLPLPALVSIHDLMHLYERRFPESTSRVQYRGRENKFRNICRWAKGVLVDSKIGGQQVSESYGLEKERIHVLPFIPPRYMEQTTVPPDFDRRYRLPAKFFFYPAQFWEHKNHRNLVRALARLKPELPDVKLVLAGSQKNAYGSVMRLVQELNLTNDVLFLGYVPDRDMPELYRRARALVMPTYFGPTNIPPLEAFAAGCPVAVSDVYGMPEQVGDAGLLFDPDVVEGIAACLRRLWTDDRLIGELSEKGKQRAERWGKAQFNQRLEAIVDRVLHHDDHPGESGNL
jgi:glycosyltransferase involved in cell wall biosynthesis